MSAAGDYHVRHQIFNQVVVGGHVMDDITTNALAAAFLRRFAAIMMFVRRNHLVRHATTRTSTNGEATSK